MRSSIRLLRRLLLQRRPSLRPEAGRRQRVRRRVRTFMRWSLSRDRGRIFRTLLPSRLQFQRPYMPSHGLRQPRRLHLPRRRGRMRRFKLQRRHSHTSPLRRLRGVCDHQRAMHGLPSLFQRIELLIRVDLEAGAIPDQRVSQPLRGEPPDKLRRVSVTRSSSPDPP